MRNKSLGFILLFAALGAMARAQPAAPTAAPNYPPSPDPYNYPFGGQPSSGQSTYSGYNNFNQGPVIEGTVTVPYAFDWHAVGVSAELGALFRNQHFVGGEVSYYGGDSRRYNVYDRNTYVGYFRSHQNITTVDAAYRYTAPLGYGANSPISMYVGGSVGVAFVDYSNSGAAFGFHRRNDGQFTGEGLIGLQFNPSGRGPGARIGYRYIFINDAWRYDRRVNLDSSALEGSISFRF